MMVFCVVSIIIVIVFSLISIYSNINKLAFCRAKEIVDYINKHSQNGGLPNINDIPFKTEVKLFIFKTKIKILYSNNNFKVEYHQKPFGPFHYYDNENYSWHYEE